MDQVAVRTIRTKRKNSAAELERSRWAKRSLRNRKARKRADIFESSSRPFLPLLLKVIVCIPDETAGEVLFERLNTSGRDRPRLCLACRRNRTTRLLTTGQQGRQRAKGKGRNK